MSGRMSIRKLCAAGGLVAAVVIGLFLVLAVENHTLSLAMALFFGGLAGLIGARLGEWIERRQRESI
jgi:hypothetical protein